MKICVKSEKICGYISRKGAEAQREYEKIYAGENEEVRKFENLFESVQLLIRTILFCENLCEI